jgi:chromosome partitioning protein
MPTGNTTKVVTVANNKGGTGKSQVTAQTAGGLARQGKRVLVIDMDPQANLTRRLGVTQDATELVTVSEIIRADAAGAGRDYVVQCGWVDESGKPTAEAELIDVMAARFDLINREHEAGVVGAFRRLKKALEGWIDEYDFVLIDTRPDLGHLVQMAFAASDYVVIPTDPSYDGVEAAIRVRDFVAQHAADLANPELQVGGVLVTRRQRSTEQDFQIQGIHDQFGDLVWNLAGPARVDGKDVVVPRYIPEWTRYAEADAAAVSATAWHDSRGRDTVAIYDKVARLFIERFAS